MTSLTTLIDAYLPILLGFVLACTVHRRLYLSNVDSSPVILRIIIYVRVVLIGVVGGLGNPHLKVIDR